jgi:hypothetical protein
LFIFGFCESVTLETGSGVERLPLHQLTPCDFHKCVLIWKPGIIFVFASVKMDITPKKWAKIVALNEHISVTVRDIASDVAV